MNNKYKHYQTGEDFLVENPDSLDWHIVQRAQEFTINVYENGASIGGAISLVLNNNNTVSGEGIIHDNNSDQDISVYVQGHVEYCPEPFMQCSEVRNDLTIYNKDTGAEVLKLGNDAWEALPFLIDVDSYDHVYLFGEYHDLDGNVTGGVVAEFIGIFG